MVILSQFNKIKLSSKGIFSFNLQPAPAWTAILGLVLLTILGILGAGSIMRLVFPVASFAVGVFLYQKYPIFYVSFTWWIWFLTPLVRRLVDYKSGYQEQSLILITPFLVTLACFPSFFQYLLKSYPYRQGGLPFILAFLGIIYSFLLGSTIILEKGFNITLIRSLIEWLTPIIFGFYIFSNWQNYPEYRQNIERTFFWGALIIGIYGLVQFCILPPWDLLWQQEALKFGFGNVGEPVPFKLSVWSTLNAPGHLACVMIPCILLLLNGRQPLRIPISIISILILLLANNRTCWGGFLIGCLVLISYLKSRLKIRVITACLVIVLTVFPLATMEPFSNKINDRIQTLSNVEQDYSFQTRKHIYNALLDSSLTNPMGYGMNSLPLADSGVLVILYEMGWLGSIFYVGGYILLLLNLLQKFKGSSDSFIVAARAASLGLFIMIPNGNILTAFPGTLICSFMSLVLAGNRYYQYRLSK